MIIEVAFGVVLGWLAIKYLPQLLVGAAAIVVLAVAVSVVAAIVWGIIALVQAAGFSDYLSFKLTKALFIILGVGLVSFFYTLFTGRSLTDSSPSKSPDQS